jgi:hypothetical protein
MAMAFLTLVLGNAAASEFQEQKSGVIPDGKGRKENVPDYVAYEVLLRSLIELPETSEDGRAREKHRVAAHIRETGLSEAGGQALLSAASEFLGRISPLDREAHQAKWQVWLSPERDRFTRLSDLQRDKIRVMDSVIYSLQAKLGNEDAVKLMQYLETSIKQKIIVLELPDHILLTDKSEMPAYGKGYNYCETVVGYDRLEMYGWCAVVEDYDVSALGYSVTCSTAGPGGKPSSSAKSGQRPAPFGIVAVTPMCVDDVCYDGTFTTNSSVMGIRIDQRLEKK